MTRPKIHRIGEVHVSNQNLKIEIIEYFGSHNCTIKFINDGVILKNISYGALKRGEPKNPYYPSMYGIGYMGEGSYKSCINYKPVKAFEVWSSMLSRCYYKKFEHNHVSYIGCSVAEEWHNYQTFAKWFEENYVEGFELDKDLLIKGNKIYSPNTCCFVPSIINTLFIKEKSISDLPLGVRFKDNRYSARIRRNNISFHLGSFITIEEAVNAYKNAKKEYIKQLAEEYKDKINKNVYENLTNYQVE